ncbi:SOS response-associated peptidase [Streptomyces sp. RerS4]|uniref:SOS response-associated peptidase n=1 Tax=Streptomyces sp. RerS4 TaxID=2942449 RepID=UPI00201BAC46|nr:SOS response-associated peptidase [Streptomyces sp. RerS4]UQW99681.1 SOS response-associated peptidase [Streptomyces sp. RerS4]
MCGRYVSTRSPDDLADLFEIPGRSPDPVVPPSWNVAPTDPVWAVLERADRETGVLERRLRALRWGLVPSWSKTATGGAKMINARVETVAEKPAYRRAFAARRCILPADGFYEWQSVPATATAKAYKQPYFIRPQDGAVMAMAGLYEFWRDPAVPDGDDPAAWWATCTVLTTEATDDAGRIHPRMPLALAPADYDAWLDPTEGDPDALRALLTTPADGRLEVRPVTTAVNNVRNNGPELLDRVEAPSGDEGGPAGR